ncbi:MAG: hypothetical protein LBB83_01080 [Treponema sp.]|jgi:hypothetical protein|nr:hypothetical protein [Treponema sp.]
MQNFEEALDPGTETGHKNFGDYLRGRNLAGRPFPPEDAQARFAQIKAEGVDFIRYALPWKALEGAEPGLYHEEYLAYLRKLFLAADAGGLSVLIDSAGEGSADIPQTPEEETRFLDTLRHAFRRLKNCKAITGWIVPAKPGPDFRGRFAEKMREVNPRLGVYTG